MPRGVWIAVGVIVVFIGIFSNSLIALVCGVFLIAYNFMRI